MALTSFRFYRLRFTFGVSDAGLESVHFPPGKAGNVLRGALGSTLRELCCDPLHCTSARTCARRSQCGYARIFEPVLEVGAGPSGLQDPPRPFVLRATAELDGRSFAAGEAFSFDLHLFLVDNPPIPELIEALLQLADRGLGPSRGRVYVQSVDLLDLHGAAVQQVFAAGRFSQTVLPPPLELDLTTETVPQDPTPGLLAVEFLTPTELKYQGRVVEEPEFPILLSRIRDRVGSLSSLYDGSLPLALDWKALGERARDVSLASWNENPRSRIERFSTKTRQTHPLGGMLGRATYQGPFAEFLPLLRAAQFTGVGRQTVWGKGEIRVAVSSAST